MNQAFKDKFGCLYVNLYRFCERKCSFKSNLAFELSQQARMCNEQSVNRTPIIS